MDLSAASQLQRDWLGNIRGDVLAGLVVALALIPEAIAFSIIAGVDPKVGLYASFSIAVISAIAGGRPGMISAATAATAVPSGGARRGALRVHRAAGSQRPSPAEAAQRHYPRAAAPPLLRR